MPTAPSGGCKGTVAAAVDAWRFVARTAAIRRQAASPCDSTEAVDVRSEADQAELDRFGELEHLMQLVKARARQLAT